MRKRENVHSTTASPQAYISSVCVCVHTCQCFFFLPDVTLCVFVVWIQLSGWCVKSLTASLRLARTGRQRHPREGERRTETWDRPGLLLGRSMSAQPSAGGRGEKMGTAAVSFNEHSLLSSAFNLQARPALLRSIPSIHIYLKGTEAAGDSQKKFTINWINCQPSFNPSDLGRV